MQREKLTLTQLFRAESNSKLLALACALAILLEGAVHLGPLVLIGSTVLLAWYLMRPTNPAEGALNLDRSQSTTSYEGSSIAQFFSRRSSLQRLEAGLLTGALVYAFSSVFWSVSKYSSTLGVVLLLTYVLAYTAACNTSERGRSAVLTGTLGAALVLALYGFGLYVSSSSPFPYIRVQSTFPYVNSYAELLLICYIVAVALVETQKSRKLKLTWLIVAASFVAGLILTLSRGVFYVALVTLPIAVWFTPPSKRKQLLVSFVVTIVAGAGIVAVLTLLQLVLGGVLPGGMEQDGLISRSVLDFIKGIGKRVVVTQETESAIGRLSFWKTAWNAFTERPVWGFGVGTYRAWAPAFQDNIKYFSIYAHNQYVQWLSELGLIGFVMLVPIPFVLLFKGVKYTKRVNPELQVVYAGLVAASLSFWGHILVDLDWEIAGVGIAAFSLMGLANSLLVSSPQGSLFLNVFKERPNSGIAGPTSNIAAPAPLQHALNTTTGMCGASNISALGPAKSVRSSTAGIGLTSNTTAPASSQCVLNRTTIINPVPQIPQTFQGLRRAKFSVRALGSSLTPRMLQIVEAGWPKLQAAADKWMNTPPHVWRALKALVFVFLLLFVVRPYVADGYVEKAEAALLAGDISKAMTALDTASLIDSWNTDIKLRRAQLEMDMLLRTRDPDKLQKVLSYLDSAIRVSPYNHLAYQFKAEVALWAGDLRFAEEMARTAVRYAPFYPAHRYTLSKILIKLGRYEEARAELKWLMENKELFRITPAARSALFLQVEQAAVQIGLTK